MTDIAQNSIKELFSKFCNSSTIHGTYFLAESTTGKIARFLWLVVVILGAVGSVIIINRVAIQYILIISGQFFDH